VCGVEGVGGGRGELQETNHTLDESYCRQRLNTKSFWRLHDSPSVWFVSLLLRTDIGHAMKTIETPPTMLMLVPIDLSSSHQQIPTTQVASCSALPLFHPTSFVTWMRATVFQAHHTRTFRCVVVFVIGHVLSEVLQS
jgi:hypothetical protein